MRSALVLAAAFVAAPALAQEQMPSRKAGLWEMTMTFEGRGAPPQTKSRRGRTREAFDHVGLLVDGSPGTAGAPFT